MSSKSLLILAKVKLQKALKVQEGKLGNLNRANKTTNQKQKSKIAERVSVRDRKEDTDHDEHNECIEIIEDYRTLKIATHNINGVKGNIVKLEMLMDWASREKIDLIGINETNITERQISFSMNKQKEYLGIWTDAEVNKRKVQE